jgi:hypothetical protein
MIIKICTALLVLASGHAFSNDQATQNYAGDPIDISGNQRLEVINTDDDELKFFRNELSNIKNLKTGFKKKATVLDNLNQEAQTLNSEHKTYARKKIKYNSQIDKYKANQACLAKTNNVDKCFKNDTDFFLQSFNTQIQRHRGLFEKCYQAQLEKTESTKGQVKFNFRFLPSGKIEHISIVDNLNDKNKNLIRCVYSKISLIKFPKTGKDKKIIIGKAFNFNLTERQ